MSNHTNASSSSSGSVSLSVDCDDAQTCGGCLERAGCAWCAATYECRRNDQTTCSCLDEWTSECPESTIACYQPESQQACRACLSSGLCQWCDVPENDCGDASFCSFTGSRSGRALTCASATVGSTDSCPRKREDSTTFELSNASVYIAVAIGLFALFVLMCGPQLSRRWLGRSRRAASARRAERSRRHEVAAREIAVAARAVAITGLPELRLGPEGKEGECTICLEDYHPGELLMILPCLHAYHKRCAERWLLEPTSDGRCPMCKESI